jgi:signal transduction histidine kinase
MIRSLAGRLVLGATIWVAVALAGAGIGLNRMFSDYIEREFDDQLRTWLDVLALAAQHNAGATTGSAPQMSDPRFEKPSSGWYWQISYPEAPPLRSHSLLERTLPTVETPLHGEAVHTTIKDEDGRALRLVERQVRLPRGDGFAHLAVAGLLDDAVQDIQTFAGITVWALAILGIGLVVSVVVVVRLGLAPLYRLGDSVAAVRDGRAERIEGDYPTELAPLARELNALVEQNATVMERARRHVGDLAHALKTPLAILANEAVNLQSPLARMVREQATAMRRYIDHYLIRARTAGTPDLLRAPVPVRRVVEDLRRTLAKIHAERGLTIEVGASEQVFFAGERQDLEEMLGNLIDNACKWASARVVIGLERRGTVVAVTIEDDGPGLPPELYETVFRRGARLDEAIPGSGLGLGIVRDIAQLYGGDVNLGPSPLGGLSAILTLPEPRRLPTAA